MPAVEGWASLKNLPGILADSDNFLSDWNLQGYRAGRNRFAFMHELFDRRDMCTERVCKISHCKGWYSRGVWLNCSRGMNHGVVLSQ